MNEEIKIQMIMVCQKHGESCDKEGCVIEAGDKVHLFCCSKGFERSLEDYQNSLKK